MEHGLVFFEDKALFNTDGVSSSELIQINENSKSKTLYKEMLSKYGFSLTDSTTGKEPGIEDLFDFVKDAFEKHFQCHLDVELSHKYIASSDGKRAVKHDEKSRIFVSEGLVYIDELMISVLYEYVAVYYIWSGHGDSVYDFCFPYTFNNLNYCCRQGYINSDDHKTEVLHMLDKYCKDIGLQFVSDMYWNILAFSFCHELAHVYLGHIHKDDRELTQEEQINEELEADRTGYDVILSIIDGKIPDLDSPFEKCFHDYLYAAPMILFLFYEDLFFLEQQVFHEKVNMDGHPPLQERIQQLLGVSEQEKYQFDTTEGNDVLSSFWDVSDCFRSETYIKFKKGKLDHIEGVKRGTSDE